jgi:hypothetical protein
MKILIVSDSHGWHQNFERVCKKEAPFDMVFHLGDTEGDANADKMAAKAGCPFYVVAGNHDYNSDKPKELELQIEGERAWLTHSHEYITVFSRDALAKEAKKRGCTLVFYGHTHKSCLEELDGITLVNPGSISFPRDYRNMAPSYVMMDTEKTGLDRFTVHYLR